MLNRIIFSSQAEVEHSFPVRAAQQHSAPRKEEIGTRSAGKHEVTSLLRRDHIFHLSAPSESQWGEHKLRPPDAGGSSELGPCLLSGPPLDSRGGMLMTF